MNRTRRRPLSWLKQRVVPSGRKARRVPLGLFRGLTFELDLHTRAQIYLGLWERETYGFLRTAAARAHWMVDVGAGRGELCAFFLRAPRVERVVAFEPSPAEAEWLQVHVRANAPAAGDRLTVHETFVGTGDGEMRLDDLDLPAETPGLIKIDVDGGELEVLRSGSECLSRGALDVLVETHSAELERDCLAWLTAHGYRCRIIPNAWWRLLVPEYRPSAHNRWIAATRS